MSIKFNNIEYKIDGMIFDVDGTIWDSTEVVKDAWNRALAETGFGHIVLTADRLKGLFGLPMVEIMRNIIPEASDEEVEVFDKLCDGYEKSFLKSTPGMVYENMAEVIRNIASKMPVIIVSNCQSGYIELVMKHLNIADCVTDYVCPGDTGLLKADNIKMMVDKYQFKSPVYVGDTHMDEEACIKAGVPIIYASYGFGTVNSPIATINKPADLLELL